MKVNSQEQSKVVEATFIGQDSMPALPGIYKIEHVETGKLYLGSSINMKKRTLSHLARFKSNKTVNPMFAQALKKHGIENFKVSVVEIVLNTNQLTEREQYWLDTLKPYKPKGYNINPIANKGGFKAKYWVVFPPGEDPIFLHSVSKFAKERSLREEALSKVANNKAKHTNGYWCRYATEDEIEREAVLIFDRPDIKFTERKLTGERFITHHKNRFRVNPFLNGKRYHIGVYDTLEEAIERRDWALSQTIEQLAEYVKANSETNEGKKTSKYKGVSWNPAGYGRWEASIRVGGEQIKIGRFKDEEEAAKAYRDASNLKILHGKEALPIVKAQFERNRTAS